MLNEFIIFHISMSICYLIYGFLRKEKIKAINEFILVFMIPLLGIGHLILIKLIGTQIKDSTHILNSYKEYIREKNKIFYGEGVNLSQKINTISMEEALIYNTNREKRQLLLNILKGDYSQNVSILKSALKDEDSETSHYAASALMRIKGELDKNLQLKEIEYEKNKDSMEIMKEYIRIVKKYMESGLLDQFTYYKYRSIYLNLLKIILSKEKSNLYYEEKINYEIEVGNYQEARAYCEEYLKNFTLEEGAYLSYMKLYYNLGDYKGLYENINLLKNSFVRLSPKGLNILRFWMERTKHV
ncbi:MAG: hypothetical protein N4A57_17605 [Anaeromicrobium sp.]|jgi:hypothetical protein|uniref:hypothetical protein n=1 Tax=Anaeromicrobium sp. TaxID=1929132 RepID=UPI0025ECF2B0|nr:hypothetical protein [Anaeromicrobium sp.]MCT4596067.1 hypothetical protein [Anaeromicrobium sp.]